MAVSNFNIDITTGIFFLQHSFCGERLRSWWIIIIVLGIKSSGDFVMINN